MRAGRTDEATPGSVYIVKRAEVVTPLRPHQQRVLDKLDASKGLLVAHGMGSGKTLSAIAAADRMGLPVDLVAPAPLLANYHKELAKHTRGPLPDLRARSYEAASRGGGKVDPESLAIADEAHRMRNPGTSLHALSRQLRGARARLLLTGTPVYNQPENIAPLLNAARGDDALPEDPAAFRRDFVGERMVSPSLLQRLRGVKPAAVPELKNRDRLVDLATGYVDVEPSGTDDFPERIDEDVEVPMSRKQHEIYKYHEGALPWYLKLKVRANLPLTKSEAADLNAFSGGLRQAANTPRPYVDEMTDADEDEHATKLREAVTRFADAYKSDPRFRGVVYSNYLDGGLKPYARMLAQAGVPADVFHGGLSASAKQALIDRYNSGQLPGLLLSSAGSEGLDLKGTKLMQVLEPHFNNAKIEQAIARAIRYKSHADLPPEERKVRVQRFFATQPKGLFGKSKDLAIDRYLQNRANEKDQLGQQLMEALTEASARGPLRTRTEGQKTALAKYAGLSPAALGALLGGVGGGAYAGVRESARPDATTGSTAMHALLGGAGGAALGGWAGRHGDHTGYRRGLARGMHVADAERQSVIDLLSRQLSELL